jgi:PAS domain S-box-containing protein
VSLPESSFVSPPIRDALAAIHQQSLELLVRGAPLQDVLGALCDGIDALDPGLISSVLLADADGRHLWPAAGRRVPEDYKQLITPLPIGPAMAACGTAAFRKARVISGDIATDPLWSGLAEPYRKMALQHGLHTAWSVPIVSEHGTLLGTFGLHHAQAKSVGDDDVELLEKAGHIALIAIERDRAQKALTQALAEVKKSEGELRTIVDMIPQLIAVLAPDGQALYVNQSTLEYTGLAADQARGVEFRQRVFHPDDVERLGDERRRALERGEPFENEQRARRHDGMYRWFLIRYRPLRDERGRVVRWYATATDIDERKRSEDRIHNENLALREEIDRSSMFEEIVGSSPPLRRVLTLVEKVAPTDSTVLITGETGSGKELIARAIHKQSHRVSRAFIRVNCAAIPASLVASELFGHEKGAFTGALQRRLGRFEAANGGTVFLDEIGDLPAETQIALLRVLQDREIERVGNSHPIPVDVRVLAATNRDLEHAVATGGFRQDLYYRVGCRNSSRRQLILVHQSAKAVTPQDLTIKRAGQRTRRRCRLRRREMQSAMWPVGVVMLDEDRDGAFQIRLVQEQQPIEALCPNRAHKPLRYGICLRSPIRRSHDLDPLGAKHLVESGRELLITVAYEESDGLASIRECPGQLPRLLGHPRRGRRRRAAGKMHASTAELNEEEYVEPLQPDRLHREEIHREQVVPINPDKFPPAHAASGAHRAQARLPQPVAHRRGRDDDAKAFEFADDALIAPAWVFTRQTDREPSKVAPNWSATTMVWIRPALGHQPSMPA